MLAITNCQISDVGNKRNEAILELARACQILAQAMLHDHTNSYGIYVEAPKEAVAKPKNKK